jgi:hydrogenase expression/formation protein HypC
MCLGIPGKVVEVFREHGLLMGRVDFGGVRKRVCFEYIPDVAVGEYALVHVGFALTRLDEAEAARVFALLTELGEAAELREGGDEVPR